jgi:hypothetical protein
MKSIRLALGSQLMLLAFFAGASQAQVQRTFVSGLGSDNNPCTRSAPCRTFGQAITGTSAGGEVYVLDTAGYGPFVVTKSITINAPQGVIAGISVFSGDGIDVNAGANDTVILRGLTVNNQGGSSGIVFNTGGTLHIEGCVANGFTRGDGIAILSPGNIVVKDTIARGNLSGLRVQPSSSGTALVAMDGLHLDCNTIGFTAVVDQAGEGVSAAIRNSSISGNSSGMGVQSRQSGATAFLDIESCMVTNNEIGLVADVNFGGSAALSISNCTISHNSFSSFFVNGGADAAIFSRGNNTILGNGDDRGFLTPLAPR